MPAMSASPISARRRSRRCIGAFTGFCSRTGSRPRSHRRSAMAERVLPLPPLRPEREITLDTMGAVGDVARPLTPFERISNITAVRRLAVLVVLCTAWELYARVAANPLLFPSFTDTIDAWWDALVRGPLLSRTFISLQVL